MVRYKDDKVYLNDKFYHYIEEQDLLDRLCGFVEDNDTIYVQYKHYHFGFHFSHSGYFKKIRRAKYSFGMLKHKNDIELIFDNKGVIFSKKTSNFSKEVLIELMFNEPIKEQSEKLFYSPDKMKRLIITKNDIGSYTYHIEKLTLLEGEEINLFGKRALWEPVFGNDSVSFYENINDLLKDIDIEIKGWIEKRNYTKISKMKISKIIEYNYNYAEYLISDGSHEVKCICNSVPLPNNQEPKVGMSVKTLYAYAYDNNTNLIISKNMNYYIQKEKDYFKYKVCGTIENHKKALIRVFDFIISLEYDYPEGFNFFLQDGYVEFEVDRFDCDLDI